MRLVSKTIISITFFLLLFVQAFFVPTSVRAAESCPGAVEGFGVELPPYVPGLKHTVSFDTTSWSKDYTYFVLVRSREYAPDTFGNQEAKSPSFSLGSNTSVSNSDGKITVSGSKVTFEITSSWALQNRGSSYAYEDTHYVEIRRYSTFAAGNWFNYFCSPGTYKTSPGIKGCTVTVYQNRSDQGGDSCYLGGDNSCIQTSSSETVNVRVDNLKYTDGKVVDGQEVSFVFGQPGAGVAPDSFQTIVNGSATGAFYPNGKGKFTFQLRLRRSGVNYDIPGCYREINVEEVCTDKCNKTETSMDTTTDLNIVSTFQICAQISNTELKAKCEQCAGGPDGRAGVWTAVGCIERSPQNIVQRFIEIGLGVGGGICLLMTLAAGFKLTISQGDPKEVNEAKEMITSAIVGLLFIIFSVFILQFIGVTIFQIPGFGGS